MALPCLIKALHLHKRKPHACAFIPNIQHPAQLKLVSGAGVVW